MIRVPDQTGFHDITEFFSVVVRKIKSRNQFLDRGAREPWQVESEIARQFLSIVPKSAKRCFLALFRASEDLQDPPCLVELVAPWE
ncbi:hypothetical protein OGATHE_001240 [Ogataea polymorpha]|uniref:Uncharacterized protein n=1 Tax=Ogataea polymorpha TaxID=460523 RepID=A0A9P8PSB6_9ASCO|nr:hypothetical protein OGATHE_001240 [Ogataea polymorpha]